MNIIIAGNGKVGTSLALRLSEEGYNLTLIDSDREYSYEYYQMKNSESILTPSLTLDPETGYFHFFSDAASSYFHTGLYTVEGDLLTGFTGDGRYTYRFKILDEYTLQYREEGSVPAPVYTAEPLKDGDLFTRKLTS